MTLGQTPTRPDVFRSTAAYRIVRVKPDSLDALPHRGCSTLLPDEISADLFSHVGRRSIPPLIVAVVMVLQRLEGPSDREAVERFGFDVRWTSAAGGLGSDHLGSAHTALANRHARLARSACPSRIFEVALDAPRACGPDGSPPGARPQRAP